MAIYFLTLKTNNPFTVIAIDAENAEIKQNYANVVLATDNAEIEFLLEDIKHFNLEPAGETT